ncbi:MAG: DUF2442 domain-containing protein [Chloroflexi bacterium]|nr:DUF2442 domain-containing protein [Chloroflexota bacterium]
MITLELEREPRIADVILRRDSFAVVLADGRALVVPVTWYPRLMHGTARERKNWRLLGNGYAIEWPELDEHVSVEGLLAGRRSTESSTSIKKWLLARRKAA